MEQGGAHSAGEGGAGLQVTETGALHGGCLAAERREGVCDPAPREVGGGVEPAPIPVRAPHAQTGAPGDDDARVEGANVGHGQPGPLQGARQPIGQEHVGAGQQPAEQLTAGFRLDVDGDAALAPIAQFEDEVGVGPRRLPGEPADHQRPPRVTGAHAFHLDDVGAPVRQGRTGGGDVGPGRQFDHPHAPQDTTVHA